MWLAGAAAVVVRRVVVVDAVLLHVVGVDRHVVRGRGGVVGVVVDPAMLVHCEVLQLEVFLGHQGGFD